ncbi:MAG: hypothetical protein ACYCPS_05310 [Candidatus Saccharimonadales bacterium]
MQYSDLGLALLYYDLAMYQIESVRRRKVKLVLVHRYAGVRFSGHCIPGEEDILSAWLVHQGRSYELPLSTTHLILLDLLARHNGISLNAQQIQERLNNELFYVQLTHVRSSRTAVRQQVRRIRVCMAECFAEAHLDIDAETVLRSEPTSTNEKKYRLHANVIVEHEASFQNAQRPVRKP